MTSCSKIGPNDLNVSLTSPHNCLKVMKHCLSVLYYVYSAMNSVS